MVTVGFSDGSQTRARFQNSYRVVQIVQKGKSYIGKTKNTDSVVCVHDSHRISKILSFNFLTVSSGRFS